VNRKQSLLIYAVLLIFCSGCAGRAANPVSIYQHGDTDKSCPNLESELKIIQSQIVELIPSADKTAKNWILGTTGYFLIVPLFFMDLSKAEQQEVNALRHRYNYLLSVAADNVCGFDREPLPSFGDKKVMKSFHEQNKVMFPEA
jgi:hypothetical protein